MAKLAPLVSIITATRNRSFLIQRAIESVLSQTYDNIEYVIVDGASSDDTRTVVAQYHDSRIKYVHLDDYGFTLQTKVGFEHSSGSYVSFLDDDDEYLPTKIEKQVALIESLPSEYGFVYCWMSYYDNATHDFLCRHEAELRGDVADLVAERPAVSGTPTFLFRRNVFEEFGGTWKENIGWDGSDWEFATRVCQKYLVDFVPESLVKIYGNHGATRMSDAANDAGAFERTIIFREHFLAEFRSSFERNPRSKAGHLYELSRCCFMLGDWKKGWRYYRDLLSTGVTRRALLLPVNCMMNRNRDIRSANGTVSAGRSHAPTRQPDRGTGAAARADGAELNR